MPDLRSAGSRQPKYSAVSPRSIIKLLAPAAGPAGSCCAALQLQIMSASILLCCNARCVRPWIHASSLPETIIDFGLHCEQLKGADQDTRPQSCIPVCSEIGVGPSNSTARGIVCRPCAPAHAKCFRKFRHENLRSLTPSNK